MTTAETVEKTRRAPRPETIPSLTLELLEAGTAAAQRSLGLARTVAGTSLAVTDAAVLGSIEVAEEWAAATPVAGLAVPPVKVVRETWTAARDGLRELVAAV